jgi:asparagine synthase (glutamine-hydrolysing)
MSGFVLIYNRDGAPADPELLTGMMGRLAHRGPDGSDVRLHGPVALGHQHFWTTPEEVGERQPLTDGGGQLDLVFDGRLDNRDELIAALRLGVATGRQTSDAAIVLAGYQEWGEQCVEHLLGPFAVAIYDSLTQRVVCARDALGDRTLFYYLDSRQLIVGSEEQAVLAHPAVSGRLNETTVALYFAVESPADGATFFRDIRELVPAHLMVVEAERERKRRYWEPDPKLRIQYRTDEEYANHYRALLEEAVRCRLRCPSPPAVMMSGGLDSTSVAALAARELAANGARDRLRAISYVFDELKECDERPYMDALLAMYDIEPLRLLGDEAWPLRAPASLPQSRNGPDRNAYRRLLQSTYELAHSSGSTVLLTGGFGDHAYTGTEDWLADLVGGWRLGEAGRQLVYLARRFGLRATLTSRGVRRLGRRVLDHIPYGSKLRPRWQPSRPPWLTVHAADHITAADAWTPVGLAGRRPTQVQRVMGPTAAYGARASCHYASLEGVELRYPHRDRRAVEFMLAVPAHQLYSHGRYKHVLRNAMLDILPEVIRHRDRPTSLMPLYALGLVEREWLTVRACLSGPDATWQKYVRPEWLWSVLPDQIAAQRDGVGAVVPWCCLAYELWLLHHQHNYDSMGIVQSGSWGTRGWTV